MPHAHFAAVLGIKQNVLQDFIRILYGVNDIPHTFSVSQEVPGLIQFNADFFNDAPEFIFSSDHTDSFLINFNAWGPMTVALPQIQDGEWTLVPETREVKVLAEILVPHRIGIEGMDLLFGMHPQRATLVSTTISVISGGPFSQGVQTLIDSSIFHNMLEEAIRTTLNDLNDDMPTLNIGFLEPMLGPIMENDSEDQSQELYTYARLFDEALIIGIDIARNGYGSAGRPNQMSDITNDMGMVLVTNAQYWVPNLRDELLEGTEDVKGIREQVGNEGATLDSFDVNLLEGHMHIDGTATKSPYGAVDFSFDILPKLIRPAVTIDLGYDELGYPCRRYIPSREELWFDIQNITVDVDTAWWVGFVRVIGGISSFGIVAVYINQMIWTVRINVHAELADADRVQGDNRTYEFRISADAPIIRAHIESCEFHTYGVYMGLSVTPHYPSPRILCVSSPFRPGLDYHILDAIERLRDTPAHYRVQLPHNVHPEDPYLNIRWTVRKMDNNTILHNSDGQAQSSVDLIFSEIDEATELKISCRVYRTLGEDIEDFFNSSITTRFCDRLDRSHPYVRWYHYAYTPDVHVEDDGSHTEVGYHIKYRISRLHRTDFPERCRMVARYSTVTPCGFRPGELKKSRIEYMDELPFPESKIKEYRDELCDYCFFGSPVNSEPLPLPSDARN